MPFVKKIDSKEFQRSTDPRKIFIGRTNELHFFVEHILKPMHPAHNIISIWGHGGVGKSTLLTRFVDETRSPDFKDYCLAALVDERQVTPVNIMERFADQLHMKGEFEKAMSRYKEALRNQTERNTGRDAFLHKVPDWVGATFEGVPFAGGILKEGARSATEYAMNEHLTHQRHNDAERLYDPIGDLTKAFVEELNRLARSIRERGYRRVILFFDTFEQLGIDAAPWLLNYFLPIDMSNYIVLVVAGRDPIERSNDPKRWLPYSDDGTIYSISLDSFTEDETRSYLVTRGITEPARIATIWQLSQGLPLYLGLLTSNLQGTVDPTKDVVENFLRWIPEQEQVKRRIALDASLLSKPFNQDDLEAFSYLPEHERSALYQWLTELPFVRSSPQDGRHSYHELAQALFSRHLFQLSRKQYDATRKALADYYRRLLEKTQTEGGGIVYHTAVQGRAVFYSTEWLELAMALAYQLFLLSDDVSHDEAVERVLNAYEYTEHTEEIVRDLRNLSQKQPNNLIVGQLLRYIEADQQNKQELLEAAGALLKTIECKPSFSKEPQAHIYRKRGFAYRSLKQLEPAIADYDRAIEFDSNYARAYASRGSAYRMLGEYERAIQDYDQALELNRNYAWAYNGRGETYRLRKEYSRALEDLNHAIELEPNYARAYARRGLIHLCLRNIKLARADYIRSWELNPAFINPAWMAGWSKMCENGIDPEMAERLAAIAAANQDQYAAYICRGVALWQQRDYAEALKELKQAIKTEPEEWGAYFWKGMACASLSQDKDAIEAIEESLRMGLPPVLLAPLRWLEQDKSDFYKEYVVPLLARTTV